MTQQVVRARVEIPSGNTYGAMATNDFYFEATGADADLPILTGSHTTVDTHLTAFYNSLGGGQSEKICFYLSTDVSRASNAVTTTYTDITAHLDGSAAGGPFASSSWTMGAGSGGFPLAPGLAATAAYRANYGSDIEHGTGSRPRARDRGRVFIGPLDEYCSGAHTDGSVPGGKLANLFVSDLAAAFDTLANTVNEGDDDQFNLVQWSRKNAAVKQVTYYYADTAFSYQRRREHEEAVRVHTWAPV